MVDKGFIPEWLEPFLVGSLPWAIEQTIETSQALTESISSELEGTTDSYSNQLSFGTIGVADLVMTQARNYLRLGRTAQADPGRAMGLISSEIPKIGFGALGAGLNYLDAMTLGHGAGTIKAGFNSVKAVTSQGVKKTLSTAGSKVFNSVKSFGSVIKPSNVGYRAQLSRKLTEFGSKYGQKIAYAGARTYGRVAGNLG
jgi:hypothetical protein